MTVVAVARNGRSVAMGADTGSFGSSSAEGVKTSKVWRVDDSLIGSAGSWRVIEVARNCASSNPERIRDALRESVSDTGEWEVAVATKNAIYVIDGDFGIVEYAARYVALGSSEVALGALWATKSLAPRDSVKAALEASRAHTFLSRAPYKILSI